ncbi:MAG: DUF721 domain-containing protein [Bacteroidetes bacterium]|nr:DUF721 domain-containing protein [Bacteroidota bacterium]
MNNDMNLGDAIADMLRNLKLDKKLLEHRLMGSWEAIAGKSISMHTKKMVVRDRVLWVYMDSAAARHELSYHRQQIIDALNQAAGQTVIDDMILK